MLQETRSQRRGRRMGPLKSPFFLSPPPTSPPSKTPPPPPPLRRPNLPLPPPPPLPPLSSHLFLPSPSPPLPPPRCSHPRGPRHGTPPPGAGAPASALPARSFPSPGDTQSAKGGSFVEHLVHERGVPVTAPARAVGDDVPGEGDLAGVPAELLPPKKRVVRYHPYAAAWAIQELASRGGFLAVDVAADRGEREDGLRAELLRLRIPRPALVLTKRLTITDRSRDKARLLLPDVLVTPSPLLGMLTAAERRLVFGRGLPVPALDRLGRPYRMSLRRDPAARTYRLTGEWSLFVSRHDVRAGDAVEVRAFRPPAWQARLEKHGEGGLGMALLHCRNDDHRWSNRERDAAEGLLLVAVSGGRDLQRTPSCRSRPAEPNR